MLDKAVGWMRGLTEAGIALIALGVVLQIIWPGAAAIPFIGIDIVGNVLALVAKLGGEGASKNAAEHIVARLKAPK